MFIFPALAGLMMEKGVFSLSIVHETGKVW